MGRALISAERWSKSRVCAGLHSAPVRRSVDKEIGATREVVVIISPCRGVRGAFVIWRLVGIRGRSIAWSCCKNEFEETKEFADLRTGDDKGRKQAQRKIVSAIDEQAALHGFGDEGIAIDRKLDAEHQAFGANFADEIEFGGKFREAIAQFGAALADIFEELFILDDVEEFEGNGARQRAATKGGAVQAGRNAGSDGFGCEDGAERKSGGERLGDDRDVWP